MGFFSRYGAFAANSGLEQKTLCITLYTRFELEIEKKTFDCNPYLFVKYTILSILPFSNSILYIHWLSRSTKKKINQFKIRHLILQGCSLFCGIYWHYLHSLLDKSASTFISFIIIDVMLQNHL